MGQAERVETAGSGLENMFRKGTETNIVVMKEAILRFGKLALQGSLRAVTAIHCVSQETFIDDVSIEVASLA